MQNLSPWQSVRQFFSPQPLPVGDSERQLVARIRTAAEPLARASDQELRDEVGRLQLLAANRKADELVDSPWHSKRPAARSVCCSTTLNCWPA